MTPKQTSRRKKSLVSSDRGVECSSHSTELYVFAHQGPPAGLSASDRRLNFVGHLSSSGATLNSKLGIDELCCSRCRQPKGFRRPRTCERTGNPGGYLHRDQAAGSSGAYAAIKGPCTQRRARGYWLPPQRKNPRSGAFSRPIYFCWIDGAIFSAGAGGSAGLALSFCACGSGRAGSGAGVVGRTPPGFELGGGLVLRRGAWRGLQRLRRLRHLRIADFELGQRKPA